VTRPTTRASARWLVALTLTSACARGRCTDNKAPPMQPPRNVDVTERVLTIAEYEAVVYGPGPEATFVETSAIEHETIQALIPKLFEAAQATRPPDPRTWQSEAAAAGFQIEIWTVSGGSYWALLERRDRARGAGAYIFRVAPDEDGPAILLEAPHNYYDVGTGRLAAELFFSPPPGARPRALFTNTMHRYQLAPGDKQRRRHNPADVAHAPLHAFSIATEAFAIAANGVRVIQLHGFGARDDDDDDDGDGGELGAVAMVVSAGDEAGSSPLTTALASELVKQLGRDIKRFPEDVRFLGATTNAQGRLLRRIDHAEFVHVEMSAELRKRLGDSARLRHEVAQILFNTSPARD